MMRVKNDQVFGGKMLRRVDNENSIDSSHDGHYVRKHEPIQVIEELEMMAPDDMPRVMRLLLSHARKYVLRIGQKGDRKQWEQDIDKAINYLVRAKTGKWPWESNER